MYPPTRCKLAVWGRRETRLSLSEAAHTWSWSHRGWALKEAKLLPLSSLRSHEVGGDEIHDAVGIAVAVAA
jgi:hypothetical protein